MYLGAILEPKCATSQIIQNLSRKPKSYLVDEHARKSLFHRTG
jgi:hypothetical protein